MQAIIHWILSLMIVTSMQAGLTDATSVPPQQEVQEFMNAITSAQVKQLDRYASNSYVNFVTHLKGDKETVKRMRKALLKDLPYELRGTEERDGVAVVRVDIRQGDYSKVLKKYKKESYDYIVDHLYDEDIVDKDKLNDICLDMYVSQIEKVAKAGKKKDRSLYLVLKDNGYNGWTLQVDDDTMKKILGDLAIPEGGLNNE